MSNRNDVEYNQKIYNQLFLPCVILGLWVSISIIPFDINSIMNLSAFKWFHLHPLSMALAFIPLASLATLIKKIGGYENTKTHGFLLSLSTWLSIFGLYVIYSNKEARNAQHFQTLHGKFGLFTICSYFILMLFGGLVSFCLTYVSLCLCACDCACVCACACAMFLWFGLK